jgi:FK506-binding nuclear protein
VYFKVNGAKDIYLTGNYILPPDHGHDDEDYDSEEDMDYDLSLDEDELDDEDEEEDALDGLQDPRITEVDTDGEEEAPKLVKADKKKGKNKRPADESDGEDQADTLDDLISKSLKPAEPATNGEQKLSKKQLKKLKKNDGEAVTTAEEAPAKKGKKDQKEPQTGGKTDKKVQFAKNLEQGPTGSPKADVKKDAGKKEESSKTGLGVKVINDITIDDKKLGKGPAAKKGDKIGMRYIGKLTNGKVFDCKPLSPNRIHYQLIPPKANKKGKPFSFKLGVGEVIKGWDIGVAGMTIGGERRITIPAKLAYGSKSLPGIPANSDLVFDIKMMSIN